MNTEVQIDIAQLIEVVADGAAPNIANASFQLIAGMIALMSLPKSGRIYRVAGRRHQASAPGEAPAIRTRRLVNSMEAFFPDRLTGIVSINAPYAVYLEDNLDRPFVAPAIEAVAENFSEGVLERFAVA